LIHCRSEPRWSAPSPPMSAEPSRAVFLSYASQDAQAARRIADTLRSARVEVWFDESELLGGDAWDAKIRGQIGACALFVPVISANTQTRREGYFRLEWKLADERTHLMAEDTPFIVPVVIDDTKESTALVPKSFRAVQWTKSPAGETSPSFVNRVRKLLGEPSTQIAAATPASPHTSASTSVAKSGRMLWVAAAMGTLVLGFVAFVLLRPRDKETLGAAPPTGPITETAPALATVVPTQSLAVLAFANMSGDKDMEYFSDGISEEIVNALDRNPALRVTPRTSSFSFKGKNVAVDEIGRVLRVASVIEGSVRKAGNKVRITVKLLNATDGTRVWAKDFEREMTDIFAVQGEIAAEVAQRMGGSAAETSPNAVPIGAQTKNLDAYDAYLRGRATQISGRRGPAAIETVRLYREAVRLDPGYALAWARLAQTLVQMGVNHGGANSGYDNSAETKAMAHDPAVTALNLAPNLPEAHISMAEVRLSVDYDLQETQREIAEAERLRPNDAETAVLRVRLERASGRWGESLASFVARAAELDSQNAGSLSVLGFILIDIGRFADAERLLSRAWVLSRGGSPLRGLAACALAWTGDVPRTREILDRVPEEGRMMLFHRNRGDIRWSFRDFAGAISDFEQVRALSTESQAQTSGPRTDYVTTTYRLAQLLTKAGQSERAAQLHAEALAGAQQLVKDVPEWHPAFSALGLVLAAQGDKAGALTAVGEMERLATRTRDAVEIANMRQARAEILAVLGDTVAAIAELRAVHTMGRAYGYRLRLEPEWESLRIDPAFQQLMKEAEAQADAQPRPTRTTTKQ
jgi:TolB-like protein/tetratricopeptide (TPR) repeat protein